MSVELIARDRLRRQLARHEGIRRSAYQDGNGYWTIGIGRCIDARLKAGLSEDESYYLLSNDIDGAVRLLSLFSWFRELDPVRQAALVNVMVNLGSQRFATFRRMLAALTRGDVIAAAAELLDSKAAREDAPDRYREIAAQLRTGEWQV